MKNRLTCVALILAGPGAASAQAVPAGTVQMRPDAAGQLVLRRDTPVQLMATKEISTSDATAGQMFKLRVNSPLEVDGRIVVPVGATALGQVTSASDSGGLGKSGRMTAKLLHIQLGDVQIPLEGETSAKGTGAGSAGVAILFTGWAGFFHRGNNAKIKAGEILTGFVAEDVILEPTGTSFVRVMSPSGSVQPTLAAPQP